ncbi:MAG TPA: hypothetical protein VE669_06580 [Actinomycetota bacterium]|jgi:hypothetical protein|nr:hypothetical protein [Actinomycetota bacterium]
MAEDLRTVAKVAEAWGVSKGSLSKRLKEQAIRPDQIKANCSYYSIQRLEKLRPKLGI